MVDFWPNCMFHTLALSWTFKILMHSNGIHPLGISNAEVDNNGIIRDEHLFKYGDNFLKKGSGFNSDRQRGLLPE